MNWLFVTTRFPWPIIDGHWLRVYHLARTLRTQGDVVALLSFRGPEEGLAEYHRLDVEVLPSLEGAHVSKGRSRTPLALYAIDPRLAEAVAHHAGRFEVTVLSGFRMLQYSPEAAASGRVVADLIDDPALEYGRREAPTGFLAWAGRLKTRWRRLAYERRHMVSTAAVMFVSEADCQSFRVRHPGARVHCVPNGVDVEYFRRTESTKPADSALDAVVFTGHMSNPNNERAAVFLIQHVAPLVWKERPQTRFRIVGADPTEKTRSLAGPQVEVTGRVEDLRPYLWSATVVALPMQSGTGIKNKLLEAWAADAAVVATPLACQGTPAEAGSNLLLGRTNQELADHIVDLLGNPDLRQRIVAQGRSVVERQCTWEAAAVRFRHAATE
jgi:glycosyltransferase involved in cell wall biosynthesis